MPLSPKTKSSLSTSNAPEISTITQRELQKISYIDHVVTEKDIPEIISLLEENTASPVSLKIEGQEISSLGKLKDFLITHPTIKKVSFSSNFYKRITSDFNDGLSDDRLTERTEVGLGKKEQDSINNMLTTKTKLASLHADIKRLLAPDLAHSDLDSLKSAYQQISKMEEMQKLSPSLSNQNTAGLKAACIIKILDSTKHLSKNIFSNKENLKKLKLTAEDFENIGKIKQARNLAAIEKATSAFINNHDSFFGSPPIVIQLQEITSFLNKLSQKDKEQKIEFKNTTGYSPGFNYNIPANSLNNNDVPQPQQ